MTTEKPKPHTNIFGNVEKVVSIGTVQGSVFVSTAADDEPFSKSKAFQLGYHLGALDFFVSYQKKGIPLSPLLPNWIEEAQNRCAILANAISLIVPEVPEHYFDSMSEQLSAKPLVIKKCFHIGNIIGRGWFFGVSPMQAGVIPSDEFVLERLEQAENLLGEADLPNNLLSTIRQIWEKAVSTAKTGQFAGNDKTDGEMNQAIEGIIKAIEKYKPLSSNKETSTQQYRESKKQISKIITFARAFGLPNFSSEEQASEKLKDFVRQIHRLLSYAFLDTCEVNPVQDFVYLFSIATFTEKDLSKTLQIGLICHITPFVSAFDELVTTFFDKSDQEYLDRASIYPSDLNIKLSYKWETNLPYRITRVGPKAVRIECLDSNFFTVKFPLRTSDLLVVLSAMINGKPVLYDDVDFSSLRPNEIEFMKYTEEAKKQGLDLSDFSIDISDPESWNITTKGIQRNSR